MKKNKILNIVKFGLIFYFFLIGCASHPNHHKPSLIHAKNWICFYGSSLPIEVYSSLDLAILDPDSFILQSQYISIEKNKPNFVRVGYMSVGEVEQFRWYWPKAKGKKFVLEPNPNWPESSYVDIRSLEWQELLISEVIPKIFSKGYQGLFLDTLDTAEYLEWKDPVKYAGSLKAMKDFVLKLRKLFPSKFIITNNALSLMNEWGEHIDGALVEDLYHHYNFEKKFYEATSAEHDFEKEKKMVPFLEKFKRPIFVIIYANKEQEKSIRISVRKAKQKGFFPYVSTLGLNEVGWVNPNE